jgi:hypothetical protein
MVAQGPGPRNRPAEEGGATDEGSPRLFGPGRRPRLETPPVGANSDVSLDAATLRRQGPGAAARRCEWSGPHGEEFAPDISASAGPARRSRPRMAGPVAREGMCGEQSPLPRTIATSRGDDNRDGPKRQHSDDRRSDRTDPTRQATAHGATSAQQPGGKPFQLDRPFQERTHRHARASRRPLRAQVLSTSARKPRWRARFGPTRRRWLLNGKANAAFTDKAATRAARAWPRDRRARALAWKARQVRVSCTDRGLQARARRARVAISIEERYAFTGRW